MNRSEISTALAKALAYAQCGKQADAEAMLECQGILRDAA